MIGTEARHILLQQRDRTLLQSALAMRVIHRDHALGVAGFHSVSRVNVRLAKLVDAGLLARTFIGTISGGRRAVYTITETGADAINAPADAVARLRRRVLKHGFIEHALAINDMELDAKNDPRRPINIVCTEFRRFTDRLVPSIPLIPDAYIEFTVNGESASYFLEVDLGTEALNVLRTKIEYYLTLAVSGEFATALHRPRFRALFVTTSERRLGGMRRLAARLTDRIFRFSTFDLINRDGFFAPVWQTPGGSEMLPLV